VLILFFLLGSAASDRDEAARNDIANFAFERACADEAKAYALEPTDERGFRAAHCFERIGDFDAARRVYDGLAAQGDLRDAAIGSRGQIEGRESATIGVRPFEIAVASPIHFFHPPRKAIWGLSLTIFYSATDVHHGLELGVGVARVKENFRGVSIDGLAHWVEGSAGGIELSGFGNFDHRAWGLQVAGGGNVDHSFDGVIVSGFWNRAEQANGLQVSVLNQVLFRFIGLQLGMLNINNIAFVTSAPGRTVTYPNDFDEDMSAAVASQGESKFVHGQTFGAQVGAFNYADELTGVQIGVVNVARRLHGLQLGLINVAVHNALPFMVIANVGL
jgi:hypothetical protein